jgi:hypothetical protein
MAAIKIQLEAAELAAVTRLAEALRVKPEDIAYAALNRLMLDAENSELHTDIKHTREWRDDNLPLWSDSATSIHAYESMPDEPSRPRKKK